MGSIRKTFHDDIYVIGDIIGTALNVTSAIISTTLYVAGNTTIGATPANTTTLTVYGMISIPAGGFTTGLVMEKALDIDIGANTEFDINDDLFRFTDGTNLLRVDSANGVQMNGDIKIGVGDTLYVDNILRRDTGLGELDIEGTSFSSGIFYCDFIAEKTSANGIRIDLLKIKDNTLDLISGTEIIIEENVRIRDGKALEVSAIYEADLSSDVTIYSQTIINSGFTANYAVTLANLAVGSNFGLLAVNTTGQVSVPNLLVVNEASSPDRLFINGDVQLNGGPGTGGKIDLTNGFGTIYNETLVTADAAVHVLLSSVFAGAIFILLYGQNTHPPATEIKGAYLVSVMDDTSSGTVRVRTTLLGSTGTAVTIGYADDNATECDITVKAPSVIGMEWSLLRIG